MPKNTRSSSDRDNPNYTPNEEGLDMRFRTFPDTLAMEWQNDVPQGLSFRRFGDNFGDHKPEEFRKIDGGLGLAFRKFPDAPIQGPIGKGNDAGGSSGNGSGRTGGNGGEGRSSEGRKQRK